VPTSAIVACCSSNCITPTCAGQRALPTGWQPCTRDHENQTSRLPTGHVPTCWVFNMCSTRRILDMMSCMKRYDLSINQSDASLPIHCGHNKQTTVRELLQYLGTTLCSMRPMQMQPTKQASKYETRHKNATIHTLRGP
jgi:hypothetical protein